MEKHTQSKVERFVFKFIIIIVILVVLLILIASPLTKYLAEKYDVKYTGREIAIDRAFVNPLAGNMRLKNLKIYEPDSDSVFFSINSFKIHFSIVKLLTGTYQIGSVTLDKPVVTVIRSDTIFNFSDLIRKFTQADTTKKKVVHINILNIKVNQGKIVYREPDTRAETAISEITFRSPGKYWDRDSINGEFSFKPDTGKVKGNFMVNIEQKDYHFAANVADLNLASFNQFMTEYIKNAELSAVINMDLEAKGNYEDPLNVDTHGRIEVDSFRVGKANDNIAAFKKMILKINDLNLKKGKYYFDSILLDSSVLRYERYDSLDNIHRMLNSEAVKDTIHKVADSVNMLLKIINSDYYINSFAIKNANIRFNDYSIAEKFTIAFNPINIKADSIDKKKKHVKINFNSKIEPHGSFSASLIMDPKNEKNFDAEYKLTNLPATMFNPYIITYSSHQLDRGRIEMHGAWTVRNEHIRSLNHFLVIDPSDIKKKVKGKDSKWVPIPLIMAIVRETGSMIDYQIPITGNLKDPKFRLSDVLSDLLRNILVKPPTTPYRFQVKNTEEKIEKILTVRFEMRQTKLEKEQVKFMEKIADFLKDNKEANIIVHPIYYEAKEKENILYFEAKKKYFLTTRNKKESVLSEDDSMKVERMSTKDSSFIKYLDKVLKKPLPLTLQEKCYRFVGREIVAQKFDQIAEERKKEFLKSFRKNSTEKQVEFLSLENQVPFNWFSYFKIDYKGEIPEALSAAYYKLFEFNTEPPRKKYSNLFRRR